MPTPLPAGPTRAVSAPACPFASQGFVRDTIGMRLGTVRVLRSSGRVTGCRIYALQNSPLAVKEHLPGPTQPVVEITTSRYASAAAAALAASAVAARGVNQQVHTLGASTATCFQTAFYPPDSGRDWACSVGKGATLLVVRTVVTSPALDAVRVTRAVFDAV